MTSPATSLRGEIIRRARDWADASGSPSFESGGGVVFFEPFRSADGPAHGNFLTASYGSILKDEHRRRRLGKAHPGTRHLPADRRGARETDSCTSSDALLLNIMCNPDSGVIWSSVFGVTSPPEFGVGGAVPKLVRGYLQGDESELDMIFRGRRGAIAYVVEAKLTEAHFGSPKPAAVVESYAELASVFDVRRLNRTLNGEYENYQLIRNVLAAHHHEARFLLLCDARRPDLLARLHDIMSAVRRLDLAKRCGAMTWQEIGLACADRLQSFLADKYGIES